MRVGLRQLVAKMRQYLVAIRQKNFVLELNRHKIADMKFPILALALSLSLLTACSTPQQKADKLAAKAMMYYNNGQFGAARFTILKAIAQRDDLPRQWQLLGRSELAMGLLPEAFVSYSRVLELEATNTEALQIVAEVAFQIGYRRESASAADRLLALDPTATRAMLVKGLLALDQKKIPEALKYADQILGLSAQDEYGIVLKARALAKQGEFEAGAKLIEDSIPPAVRTEASLSTLVEIFRITGETARIGPAFENLIAKRPKDPTTKLDYAQILYKAGNANAARNLLWEVLTIAPDNLSLIRKVVANWTDNDPEPLTAKQLDWIAQKGTIPLRAGVARFMIEHGQSKTAQTLLLPVVSDRANIAANDARALYATALYADGDVNQASQITKEILEDDTDNIDALLLSARVALQQKDLTAATNAAQIVVRDFPDSEDGRLMLIEILTARKDFQRVRSSYEDAIRFMPQSLVLSRKYSEYLLATGDRERAATVARDFTLKNPSTVQGWQQLAKVCDKLGNPGCKAYAAAGRAKAAATLLDDLRPGSVRSRGLFGRL
jgi:tetratricopeptide (TPR) repeat protein